MDFNPLNKKNANISKNRLQLLSMPTYVFIPFPLIIIRDLGGRIALVGSPSFYTAIKTVFINFCRNGRMQPPATISHEAQPNAHSFLMSPPQWHTAYTFYSYMKPLQWSVRTTTAHFSTGVARNPVL